MNSKIFTILVAVVAISANCESWSQPPKFAASKEEVSQAITDLEAKISTIKQEITDIKTNITNEYSLIENDTIKGLEDEKDAINQEINDLYKTCEDDKCKNCFETQDKVITSFLENIYDIQVALEDAYKIAFGDVTSFLSAVEEYTKKITAFRAELEACKDDECIIWQGSQVADYEKTVDKDDFKTKSEGEKNTFETTAAKNSNDILKTFNVTCHNILDIIQQCIENAESTIAPTTLKVETTTNSQAKLILNLYILISMLLVITKNSV